MNPEWVVCGAGVGLAGQMPGVRMYGYPAAFTIWVSKNGVRAFRTGPGRWESDSRARGLIFVPVSLEELCLPKNVAVFELAHDKLGELWVSVHANRPNRTLLVGDAFFVWRIRGD